MRFVNWTVRLVLVGALAVAAMSCGDDGDDGDSSSENTPAAAGSPTAATDGGDDEAAVEKTVRDAVAAWNAKDVNALVALFTDKGLASSFAEDEATPRAEVIASLPEFIGDPPLEIREFAADVSGESATAELTWVAGKALEQIEFGLVNEAEVWKIDSEEDVAVEIPDGVTEVTVDLNEFAFSFIPTDVTGVTGILALTGNNVGEQEHEIALAKIPADADVQQLLMTEEDVPGFEFIGAAAPIAPGEARSLVLVEPLEPGRYLLVCFFPDTTEGPEGTPHAFKGMVQEFTIPTP